MSIIRAGILDLIGSSFVRPFPQSLRRGGFTMSWHSLLALVVFVIPAGCGQSSDAAEGSAQAEALEGAWRRIEVIGTDGVVTPTQPGLRLYVDGFYSVQFVPGTEPRPALPDSNATAADLRATLGRYNATSGTYEVNGDVITQRPTVALNPAGMQPTSSATLTFRIVGDTLWLTQTGTDTGPIDNPTTTRFVRAM
jgi:hypothetical protein